MSESLDLTETYKTLAQAAGIEPLSIRTIGIHGVDALGYGYVSFELTDGSALTFLYTSRHNEAAYRDERA